MRKWPKATNLFKVLLFKWTWIDSADRMWQLSTQKPQVIVCWFDFRANSWNTYYFHVLLQMYVLFSNDGISHKMYEIKVNIYIAQQKSTCDERAHLAKPFNTRTLNRRIYLNYMTQQTRLVGCTNVELQHETGSVWCHLRRHYSISKGFLLKLNFSCNAAIINSNTL